MCCTSLKLCVNSTTNSNYGLETKIEALGTYRRFFEAAYCCEYIDDP
jgi:hypothetical protein